MSDRGQCGFSLRAVAALATFAFCAAACRGGADTDGGPEQPEVAATTTEVQVNDGTSTSAAPADDNPTPDAAPEQGSGEADAAILSDLPGRIVRRSADGSIITSAPDGSDEVMWSSGEEFANMQPTWSSDGRTLAWSRSNTTVSEIAHVQVDGDDSLSSVDVSPPPFYLSWSPGNERILGLLNGPQGIESVVVDIASSSIVAASLGQPLFTDWLSNDTLVAAVSGVVVAEVSAVDLTPQPLPIEEQLGRFQTPIALPDGGVIVTTAGSATNDVSRLNDDGTLDILARADGPVVMSLSPDAVRLAVLVAPGDEVEFISFRAQGANVPDLPAGLVSIIDLNTGVIDTRLETGLISVNWSPTGEHLGLLQLAADRLQWLFADATDMALPPMASEPFRPTVELARAYLPFLDQYNRSSTWWSPDGRAFMFAGTAFDREGIWIDRIDDDLGPAYAADGDIAFWSTE